MLDMNLAQPPLNALVKIPSRNVLEMPKRNGAALLGVRAFPVDLRSGPASG